MTLEDEIALCEFATRHGGLRRNGEMCFDKDSLDALLAATRLLERKACMEACRKIAAQYPTDIWPEDGESLDCKSARMARLTAANCEREIDMRSNAKVKGGAK